MQQMESGTPPEVDPATEEPMPEQPTGY
jgi:hypothetical protein